MQNALFFKLIDNDYLSWTTEKDKWHSRKIYSWMISSLLNRLCISIYVYVYVYVYAFHKIIFLLLNWKDYQKYHISFNPCVKLCRKTTNKIYMPWVISKRLANIDLFKFSNRSNRPKTPKRLQWLRSGVFITNFEQISQIVLVFLFLT